MAPEPAAEPFTGAVGQPGVGQQQGGGKRDGTFLRPVRDGGRREHGEREQSPPEVLGSRLRRIAVGEIGQEGAEVPGSREQLAQADAVGHGLDVDRLNREPERRDQGAPTGRRQRARREGKHQRHHEEVQRDVGRVEQRGSAPAGRPVDREQNGRGGTVGVGAVGGRPERCADQRHGIAERSAREGCPGSPTDRRTRSRSPGSWPTPPGRRRARPRRPYRTPSATAGRCSGVNAGGPPRSSGA